jgi:hypothetical protein
MDSSEASEHETVVLVSKRRELSRPARKNAIDLFMTAEEKADDELMHDASDTLGQEDEEEPQGSKIKDTSYSPLFLADDQERMGDKSRGYHTAVDAIPDIKLEVQVPACDASSAYKLYDGRVHSIIEERRKGDRIFYRVKLRSGHEETVSSRKSYSVCSVSYVTTFTYRLCPCLLWSAQALT